MVKPAGVTDPLLRRPFSVFEVLRNAAGDVTGVSILNKRAGRSTKKLYELEPGRRGVVPRSARRALHAGRRADRSLDGRRRRRARAVCHAGGIARGRENADDVVLRRAHRRRTVLSRLLRAAWHHAGAHHRRRRALRAELRQGPRHRPARSGAEECRRRRARWSTRAAPSRCSKPSPSSPLATISPARCRSNASWAAASAVVTAASCRSSTATSTRTWCVRASADPVFDGAELVWD